MLSFDSCRDACVEHSERLRTTLTNAQPSQLSHSLDLYVSTDVSNYLNRSGRLQTVREVRKSGWFLSFLLCFCSIDAM
jgi:hypothetical protein